MLYSKNPIRGNGKPNGNPADKNRKRAHVGALLTKASLNKFGKDGNSRSQFQAFLATGEVPTEMAEMLKSGKARLVDHSFFSCQDAATVTKFFQSGDEKTAGISNLKGNTLPKGYGFLVSKIRITVGKATGATPAEKARTRYNAELPTEIPAGSSGFVRFNAQNRGILQEISSDVFNGYGQTTKALGEYTLDNPRFIGDNGEINFELQFADTVGMDPLTRIKVEFYGTMCIPQ